MAIVKCFRCKETYGDEAPVCPFCGASRQRMTRVAWQCTIVGAVFGILVGSAMRNDPFFDHSYLLFIGLVGLLIGYFVGKYVQSRMEL